MLKQCSRSEQPRRLRYVQQPFAGVIARAALPHTFFKNATKALFCLPLAACAFEFSLRSPPTVELSAPLDGATTVMPHPHFQWLEIAEADRYEIQIAADPFFQTLEDSDSIAVPRYVPLDALPTGTWFWCVRPRPDGAWSPARQITINAPPALYTVSTNDSQAVTLSTIASAIANTPAKLVFEPGSYTLDLPDASWLFECRNVSNLILDGQGASLTLPNPRAGFFYSRDCQNILLRRFTVDYALADGTPVSHTAGIVTESFSDGFTFEPLPGHLPPTDPLIRDASHRTWGCLMDPNVPGRLKDGAPNFFSFTSNAVAVGTNRYQLTLSRPEHANYFQSGDLFVKNAGWGSRILTSVLCADITYESITATTSPGAYYGGNLNDGLHFLNCAVRIKSGRLIATAADGFIGAGFRTGYWIENCHTEGLLDDAINCSGYPLKLHSKPGPTTVNLYAASMLLPGEHLTLFNPPEGAVKGTFEVLNCVNTGNGYWQVELDADPGTVFPGTANWDSQFFIEERAHRHAYIRNSTFRDARRYGCLIRARDAVIEGNLFDHLGDEAIHSKNHCISFAGGLSCSNLRILNNTMNNCGNSSTFYYNNYGVINIGATAYQTNCTQTIHDGIEISGNRIYDWDGTGISVECAQNVIIQSNTVTQLNQTGFYPNGSNVTVSLNYVTGAEIKENDLRDTRAPDETIQTGQSTEVTISGNLLP